VISLCGSTGLETGAGFGKVGAGGINGFGTAGVGGTNGSALLTTGGSMRFTTGGFGTVGTKGARGLGAGLNPSGRPEEGIDGVEKDGLAGAGGNIGGLGGAPLGLFSTGKFGGRLSGIIKISISRLFLTECE
jgi:hypothetical protein